jgi:(p)ppGpp synthase/HD superfamily hydrolase
MKDVVNTALAICKKAHKGQIRRDGVTPYHEHPIAVAALLDDPIAKVVALLHDVLEGTSMPKEYIADSLRVAGMSKEDVEIVLNVLDLLTHKFGEPYDDYIIKLSENKLAKTVKCADISHNLSDSPSRGQITKYSKAIKVLI